MTDPEIIRLVEVDPFEQEALRFCADIQEAVSLAAQLKHEDPESSQAEGLWQDINRLAVHRIHESIYSVLPYKLRITLPVGADAHLSKSYEVIDPNPESFLATEVRAIGPGQVEFRRHDDDMWLIVYGHEMQIEPVFPANGELLDNLKTKLNEVIGHCEAELTSMQTGNGVITEYLDTLDSSVRDRLIELAEEELEVFQALDPRYTTEEEIAAISQSFNQKREAVHPKKAEEQ